MKLTVLVDNCTKVDNYLLAEPALSFYIEVNDKKILFDCGYSDIFIQNAFKLKIDLREVTDIVFSHGHNDHTGGLFYLKKLYQDSKDLNIDINIPVITAHPDVFKTKIEEAIGDIGCPLSKNQLRELFKTNLTKSPFWITPELCFLGVIPRPDSQICECIDDSALLYKSKEGLIIITGCSHSGLKNIIEYAVQVTKTKEIYTVIGGFHLIDKTESEIKGLIEYLKAKGIKTLYPSHCIDFQAKVTLAKKLDVKDVYVGNRITF